MAALARAAPRTIRDQFFIRKPQSQSLGPPATPVIPSNSKTFKYFKLKGSGPGKKSGRVASIVEPSKLGSASLDPKFFEPVQITVKQEVPASNAGGNSVKGPEEWFPRWDMQFGEGCGYLSAVFNLLHNAELMTPPGSIRKHGGYVNTGWDGSDQCPPQPDSLICYVDNVHDLSEAKARHTAATELSQRERASHGHEEVTLVEETPLSLAAFTEIDAANSEGTAPPDSGIGTGRNIQGRDANDKEMASLSRMWEDTHMTVVTMMQMEGAAQLSPNCHATDCDIHGIEVTFKYGDGHTAVKQIPAVKFWETLDETGWREEDFELNLKLFADEPMRQLFNFPRPEYVSPTPTTTHVGAYGFITKRNEELRQKRVEAERIKREALAKAEASSEKPLNELVQLGLDERNKMFKITQLSAKKAEQRNARIYGVQPLLTGAEIRYQKLQYRQDLRNYHLRKLKELQDGAESEARAGQSNCKVELDDSQRYQDYWTRMMQGVPSLRYQYQLALLEGTTRHRADQSVELYNRYKKYEFFNNHLPWGLEKTPGFTWKQLLKIKALDVKRWTRRKEIAAWLKEQAKDRRFMEAANKTLDWAKPFDTGYPPSEAAIKATVAALHDRILTEGTVQDENGEYLHLAQRAGIVGPEATGFPPEFWSRLALRMVKGDSVVKYTPGGIAIPDKEKLFDLNQPIVFLDALGDPITD